MEDPLYYFDHDLPTDSLEHFFSEFSARTGKKCDFCDVNKNTVQEVLHTQTEPSWLISYSDSLEDCFFKNIDYVNAYYKDEHLEIDIDLFLHSCQVSTFEIDKVDFDSTRWPYLWHYFADNEKSLAHWAERIKNCWEKYLSPFFHSKYVEIGSDCADDEFLENGGKIEDKINTEAKWIIRNEQVFDEKNFMCSPLLFDFEFITKLAEGSLVSFEKKPHSPSRLTLL